MITERLIGAVLQARAAADPDAPLVKCGGDWLTAAELDEVSDRVAEGLRQLGLGKGDRIALIVPNRQEMIELIFGCAKLGAIQVPLNYWLKGEFLRYQLNDCGASVLVADAMGEQSATPLLAETGVKQLVLLDDAPSTTGIATASYVDVRGADRTTVDVGLTPQDIAAIIYTSGTTGMPKGCMLPHGYYTGSTAAFGEMGWVQPGDRVFSAFPLFHTSGQLIATMPAFVHEASVCFEPEFSATSFMARAREEEATVVQGVGPMAMAILAQPAGDDDASGNLRLATWVPLPPPMQLAFEQRFNTSVVSEAFGQTECAPIALNAISSERNRASAGKPVPGLAVRLVDDQDEEVAVGEIGEITIRPDRPELMFAGYWDKPEATAEAWRNLWHHTGDFGRMDADGFLSFVDRKKDAIRRRGENVSSFELEAAIVQHPHIAQVAACAVPSSLGEDDIKACVVAAPGAELDPEELFEFFKEKLPYFAIPRYVDVREALPTNAMGRVQKVVLREEGIPEGSWDFEALGLSVAKADRRG